MADELVFYTNPMSRGRTVRWMLEEVGQPYRTELMQFDTLKSPAYLAVNPMGKIPAIVHGDVVVTECAAICAYLADAFPGAKLAPPGDDPARGAYYRWMFFTAGPLEQAIVNKSLGFAAPKEREVMVGYGNLDLVLDTVEKAVTGRDYLAGDAFSTADLLLGAQLGWGMMFGTIEKRPAFEAYAGRITSRPAAVRAQKIDDDLIAAAKGNPSP